MRIGFTAKLEEKPEIRAGFIGCGSHAFRNIFPTFQFAPVRLVAVCDLDAEKARAFAAKFGAGNAYGDYREMLAREDLDAVFIVTGYNEQGRPLYPEIALDCLEGGCHVWMEKPPAADTADIRRLQQAAAKAGKIVAVGFKKMYFPANEKAKELAGSKDFGNVSLALLQYPQIIPTAAQFRDYLELKKPVGHVIGFLDHLCHPVSLLIYLLGMPDKLFYARSHNGSGNATFIYSDGKIASLALTAGSSINGGLERTTLISDAARHIIIENNIRVIYHRGPPQIGYGDTPEFYHGNPDQASAIWEPEFSLGQLYNKGLFLLGYYNEINEFAGAILAGRPLQKGGLDDALQITEIFNAFARGPEQLINLKGN